jgi:uncharacterized protein (UPF0335 family)
MSAPVTADRLKSFLERIERLLEERAGIQSDIKDIFSEAKGVGYDVKTMRRLIQIRAQDSAERAEQAALLDTYMHALGMGEGAAREPTEEELEERAGRIVAEVDRCMSLVVDGNLPKIASIQALIGCSLGKASKLRGLVEERISRWNDVKRENEIALREMTADDLGDPLLVIDKPRAQFREKVRAIAASIKAPPPVEMVAAPEWDDLAIPDFLRRTA